MSFWTRDTGLEFGDAPECRILRKVSVIGVEGHAIPAEAAAAYRAILERRPNQPITLKLDGQKAPAMLTCRSDATTAPFQHLLR